MKNCRENPHLVIIALKYGQLYMKTKLSAVYCSGRYKMALKQLGSYDNGIKLLV
jgi:hypothetical protein